MRYHSGHMPIGHIYEVNQIPLVGFVVHEHEVAFRPPVYIREHRALNRIAKLDDVCTSFFLGKRRSHTRVTFKFGGVWCYVDFHDGDPVNLNHLLWDLDEEYAFVADGELRSYCAIIGPFKPASPGLIVHPAA